MHESKGIRLPRFVKQLFIVMVGHKHAVKLSFNNDIVVASSLEFICVRVDRLFRICQRLGTALSANVQMESAHHTAL